MAPKFRIIRTAQILPLMAFDEEKVSYLIQNIAESESISIPIPLMEVADNFYLLLQDSAILEAAARLGITALPAQVSIRKSKTAVFGEIYAEGFTNDLIVRFTSEFPRDTMVLTSRKDIRMYEKYDILAINVNGDSDSFLAFRRGREGHFSRLLLEFLDFIGKHCRYTQSIYNGTFPTANLKQPRYWSRLRLENMSIDSLISAGQQGTLFPANMLHFDSGYRIIGVDFPVAILNEKVPVKEKEKFLKDLISFRFRTCHPEFIGSGVFLLNTPLRK